MQYEISIMIKTEAEDSLDARDKAMDFLCNCNMHDIKFKIKEVIWMIIKCMKCDKPRYRTSQYCIHHLALAISENWIEEVKWMKIDICGVMPEIVLLDLMLVGILLFKLIVS